MTNPAPRSDDKPTAPAERDPRREWLPTALYVAAMIGLLWLWQGAFDHFTYRPLAYSDFKAHVAAGEVLDVQIGADWIRGRLAPGALDEAQSTPTPGAAGEADDSGGRTIPEPTEEESRNRSSLRPSGSRIPSLSRS